MPKTYETLTNKPVTEAVLSRSPLRVLVISDVSTRVSDSESGEVSDVRDVSVSILAKEWADGKSGFRETRLKFSPDEFEKLVHVFARSLETVKKA